MAVKADLLNLPAEVLRSICLNIHDPMNFNEEASEDRLPGGENPVFVLPRSSRGRVDLLYVALVCRKLADVVFPILRQRIECHSKDKLVKLAEADWSKDVRTLHVTIDDTNPPATSSWTESSLLLRVIDRLPSLRHLHMRGTRDTERTLALFIAGLLPPHPRPLLQHLSSFGWELIDSRCDDFECPRETRLDYLHALLQQVSRLSYLELKLEDHKLRQGELLALFQSLSRQASRAGTITTRIINLSETEFDELEMQGDPVPGIRTLLFSPMPGFDACYSSMPAMVRAIRAFPNLRRLELPKVRYAGIEDHVTFLHQLGQNAPRLLAVGIPDNDRRLTWWGIWRRESLSPKPIFRGIKHDYSDEGGDVRVIAPVEEGHLQMLEAELDDWEVQQLRAPQP